MNELISGRHFRSYILDDDGNPVYEPDQARFSVWMFGPGSIERRAVVCQELGNITISTVFLGIDHQFGNGPPLVFETMVFGGEYDGYTDRYATKEDAIAGHAEIVAMTRLSRDD